MYIALSAIFFFQFHCLKLDYNYTDKSFIKEYYNYINRHRAKYISKDLIKILQKMYKYKLY